MHYHRASEMLDHLITCSASEMCRRLHIAPKTFWNYLVQSKLGKEQLQNITWCNVAAPFHIHVQQNLPALQAAQVRQSVLEKARDGVWTDSFFQGHKQYQQISKRQHDDEVLFGLRAEGDFDLYDDDGNRVPERVWLKPDAATSLAILSAYDKRFRSHSTVEHQLGGVLRLAREPTGGAHGNAPATKVVDVQSAHLGAQSQGMLDDEDQTTASQPAHLALAAPAKDAAEMDELIKANAFEPTAVDFVDASGKRTTLIAAADPLLEKSGAPDVSPVVDDGLGLPPDPEPEPAPVNKPIEADRKFDDLMRKQSTMLRPGVVIGASGYPERVAPTDLGAASQGVRDGDDRTGRGGPPANSRAVKMV